MNRTEAEEIIKILQRAQDFLTVQSSNLEDMIEITKPLFVTNDTSDEIIKEFGEMMCNEPWAFVFPMPEGLDFTTSESSKSTHGDDIVDSCEALNQKLVQSTMGKFVWKIIAPFLKGNILYTPVDEFTQSIVKKVYSYILVTKITRKKKHGSEFLGQSICS